MQVKELLLPFGHLKAFNLVMDKNTGNSKVRQCCIQGYVFSACCAPPRHMSVLV